jgi:methyl-accepting chemotaxis protein
VKTYRHDPADPHSLGRGWVMSIHIDDAKNVWFGTEGGLTCLPDGSQQMRRYTVEDGLPHDSVTSILEDPSGSLWLGTNRGLSKFVDAVRLPEKPQFLNFDAHDGLQGKEFAPGAAFRARSGTLYFGGQRGLNHFFPDDIQRNPEPPRVVFTDLRIFNKSAKPGADGSPLEKSITETREITLSHKHSVVTFEFAALNYVLPQKNQYEYMLDGIDPGWNRVGTRHTANYTSLPHGRRLFRVRASNNDGVWSTEDAVLALTVKPRLHQTVYFWGFLLIIAAGLSYGAYHLRVATLKARERDLARRVEEATRGLREERDLRREAQERLHRDLEAFHEIAGKVADGDLTLRGDEGDTTLGRIARSVNHMLERFCGILTEVRDAAFSVSSASAEIHSASTQIAKGAQYGRDEVHQTSSAVEEIAMSMNQVAESAENAAEAARRVLEHLRESDRAVDVTAQGMMRIDEAVSQTADKMRLVGQSSERIFETIDFMEEIANRSELLSLNASIEAAHAGDTGRGFSVVADEIHRLAERSNEATKDVTAIVKGMADETRAALAAMQNSMREVKEGLQLSEQARRGLHEISSLVQRAVDLADQISLATQEQTKASQTVARAMQAISNISEESWAGANEAAKAVRDLVALSDHLTQTISRFRIDRPVDETGAPLPPEEREQVAAGLVELLAELSRAATSFGDAAPAGDEQDVISSLTQEQRAAATVRLGSVARQIAGALAKLGLLRRIDDKSRITEET